MPLVGIFVGAYHRTCSNIRCVARDKFLCSELVYISSAQVDILLRDLQRFMMHDPNSTHVDSENVQRISLIYRIL